jgi:thioredoxin-like negative regulator of GroEL/outer membrane protein assembly factor BamB
LLSYTHPSTVLHFAPRFLFFCLLLSSRLPAQTELGFEKTSLAWRTALHFDPGAEAPLRSLVELYQKEGRAGDLVTLYTEHRAQFPQDENAAVVLARLYMALKDARAEAFLQEAMSRHPQNALLRRAQAEWLELRFDPRALESLDEAVKLETAVPARRAQWLEELIKTAAQTGREDLVSARLSALTQEAVFNPAQRLHWARRCLEAGLKKSAAAVLKGGDFSALQGEEAVEALFVQSRVAWAVEQKSEAARHARALLSLLAPDHWRREEALRLHWQTADGKGREASLATAASAWKASPANESAALSYGELLVLAGKRDEALQIWQEALLSLPTARLIEARVVQLFESMRRDEDLLGFLQERVRAQPEREDLRLQLARRLLQLGRIEAGLAALEELLVKKDPAVRVTTLLQTARWLRLQNLFGEAARVLEVALTAEPQRWEVRKELAEIHLLMKRPEEMEKLFDLEMSDDVIAEVRMEVAQFLIARKMWSQARRMLEVWIQRKPGEFDARLLLARVESLAGASEASERRLSECRALCDTEARYAAWLAVAWERATELEKTEAFIQEERQRLWPKAGETWEAERLKKLGALAGQTMQSRLQDETEKLLRAALAEPKMPASAKVEIRRQLISVLDGREDKRKALEVEIETALAANQDDGAGDLRLRLALMYFQAKRLDLWRSTMMAVVPERCEDVSLLQRALVNARQTDLMPMAAAMAERMVRLQPDEKAHWITWTSMLVESGEEAKLRLALREMRARAAAWKLNDAAQETLRRHLAASCWRSVGEVIGDPDRSVDEALLCPGELEQTEQQAQRRLWLAWARGMLALRSGDETSLADARAALSGKEEWVVFPDGLSLSLTEARRMLETVAPALEVKITPTAHGDYSKPGKLSWVFRPRNKAELQRWCLTPDGKRMLVQDTHGRLYAVDRRTGKQLWDWRRVRAAVPAALTRDGGELVSYPMEWCVSDEHLTVLDESGIVCLRIADHSVEWEIPTPGVVHTGAQGTLAQSGNRVLWWRAALGRLEALDEMNGKRLWSRLIPALGEAAKSNPSSPVWLMSGMRCDGDRAVIWGSGTAVVRVSDGALIWKAATSEQPLSFPLQLDDTTSVKASVSTSGASFLSAATAARSFSSRASLTTLLLANSHAIPSFGYPGMYGSAQSSPWLLWGGEGERWLQGDGLWLISQNMASARYSSLGFPSTVTSRSRSPFYLGAATPVGTAGRSLIATSERGVVKVMPDGSARALVTYEVRDNSPEKHPLPSAGVDGTTLVVADSEQVRVLDALSGVTLWEKAWSVDASAIIASEREAMKSWQSLRWSSRGLSFYDGRGRTLVCEWRALMGGGDLVVPAGTRSLICLRCGP